MEFKITPQWKAAVKWWTVKKCNSWKNWLFQFRSYGDYTNRNGFEIRICGLGVGLLNSINQSIWNG
jgi:hypothetical protein